ncbi:hypothetical protein [Spirosoma aerophilum]
MHQTTQNQPLPGDYYGIVYKGSLVIPLLVIIMVIALALWLWSAKKRK